MVNLSHVLDKFIRYEFYYESYDWSEQQNKLVDENNRSNENYQQQDQKLEQYNQKNKLIITIKRLLMVLCVSSFVVILIYILIYPDRSIPSIIENTFFITLGWFGGILAASFQIELDQKSEQYHQKNKLIITINRLSMVLCISSFVVILIYSLIYPDRSIPSIIENTCFITLGWFGGILAAFFEIEQDPESKSISKADEILDNTTKNLEVLPKNFNKSSPSQTLENTEIDPLLRLIGSLDIDNTDLAENHDYYLRQALDQELKGDE